MSLPIRFTDFFQAATGHPPYAYQRRVACGERNGRPEAEWLTGGTACRSQLDDCLWVHDEVQLMGVGLETSAQLAGFRDGFGTIAPCVHWWMSATLESARLDTPDAPPPPVESQLSDEERLVPAVQRRLEATKRIQRARTAISDNAEACARNIVAEILSHHTSGTLTLVIVNTVERAQENYRELCRQAPSTPATLLHSRFRPHERQALVRRVLESAGDHIVVSTQVVEAGVDLSAHTLFTEVAPWSSLVQRFGRCHRHGELAATGADIRWVDVPDEEASPCSKRCSA